MIFRCMNRICFLFLFSLFFLSEPYLAGITLSSISDPVNPRNQDTTGKQILYNGRLWRDLYYRVKGDQFLFTSALLPGTVTIEGRLFRNVLVSYDIYKDELLAMNNNGLMIQLNKEKIDEFNFEYNFRRYQFENLEADSLNNLEGYVNVLFDGKMSLFVKYWKEIDMLAVENKYDQFYQVHRIYLRKEGIIYPIRGKRYFLKHLSDRKQQVRNFIKTNKLQVTKKDPDSFVPVLEYYTNLKK
jgi:hypothetical protein